MYLEYIFKIVVCIFIFVLLYLALFKILKPFLEKRNEIEYINIKNQQYSLFMQMDANAMEQEIDIMIQKYIKKYVLYNITAQNIIYVKNDQAEEMIREVCKVVDNNISELYIFYIKCLVSINDDKDLLNYIHNKVKEHVLDFLTEFNKPIE